MSGLLLEVCRLARHRDFPSPPPMSSGKPLPCLADFRSALIVKPSSLGDVVHTLPAAHAIKKAFPYLRLRWLINTEWAPLLHGIPWLDRVVEFPRKKFRGPLGLMRAWQWAKVKLPSRLEPELVLDFQGLLRSALLSRASGSKPVLGLSDSRECARLWHDHVIAVDPDAHAVDRYLCLARALGVEVKPEAVHFPLAEGVLPPEWPQRQDLIVIHPWSRGQGKSLSAAALQALCDALAPRPVILVGITDESARPRGLHITDLSGRTSLAQLIACLRAAHWVVSVDSGPMHMAAAVNDQTLALHTWSDPRRVGPYNPRAWVWKAGHIAHRPDFTSAQAETSSDITPEEARRIGLWLQTQLQPAGHRAEVPLAETVLWDVPPRPARRPRGDG